MVLVKHSSRSPLVWKKVFIVIVLLVLLGVSGAIYYMKQKGIWIFQEAGRVRYLGPPQKVVQKVFAVKSSPDDGGIKYDCVFSTSHNELYIGKCDNNSTYLGGYIVFRDIPVDALLTLQRAELIVTVDGTYKDSDITVQLYVKDIDSNTLRGILDQFQQADKGNFEQLLNSYIPSGAAGSQEINIPASDIWELGTERTYDITKLFNGLKARYTARYRGCLTGGSGTRGTVCNNLPKTNLVIVYRTTNVSESGGASSHRRFFAFERGRTKAPRLKMSYQPITSERVDKGRETIDGGLPAVGQIIRVDNPVHACLTRRAAGGYGDEVVGIGPNGKPMKVRDLIASRYKKALASQNRTDPTDVILTHTDFEYYVLPTPCDINRCFGGKKSKVGDVCVQVVTLVARYAGRVDIKVDGGSAGQCVKTVERDDIITVSGAIYSLKKPKVISYICGGGKPINYIGPPEGDNSLENEGGGVATSTTPTPVPTAEGTIPTPTVAITYTPTPTPATDSGGNTPPAPSPASGGDGAASGDSGSDYSTPGSGGASGGGMTGTAAGGTGSTASSGTMGSGYASGAADTGRTNGVRITWKRSRTSSSQNRGGFLADSGFDNRTGVATLDSRVSVNDEYYQDQGAGTDTRTAEYEDYQRVQSRTAIAGILMGTGVLGIAGVLWWAVKSGMIGGGRGVVS